MKKTINFILVSFCLLMAVMTGVPAQAQSGAVNGFDVSSILYIDYPDPDFPGVNMKKDIPSILKNNGFELSSSKTTELSDWDEELGEEIKEICREDTYNKNGLSVSLTSRTDDNFCYFVTFIFPNISSRDEFIKSATQFGFKKDSSDMYVMGTVMFTIEGNEIVLRYNT
ncbi:MAG: hypothetical protein K2N05_05920 [Muribaculaceae bacterium]|nr:hypothetical protein [Muribaculaceae bacterium]